MNDKGRTNSSGPCLCVWMHYSRVEASGGGALFVDFSGGDDFPDVPGGFADG